MSWQGYAIVGPVSPWDEKHRDAIEMDGARRTIGATPGEAWSIQCRRGLDSIDHGEFSRRVQHWHDRGYRLRRVTIELHPEEAPDPATQNAKD